MADRRLMNTDHLKSARPCGCDEGAGHMCSWHKEEFFKDCGEPSPMFQKGIESIPQWGNLPREASVAIGGAPTRASVLPPDAKWRKTFPVASGVLDYFPDALSVIANVSYLGNEQHNPGQPLHWARGKSTDEADTMIRHFLQRGSLDTDGIRHTAKMAWRALALLQKELEAEVREGK